MTTIETITPNSNSNAQVTISTSENRYQLDLFLDGEKVAGETYYTPNIEKAREMAMQLAIYWDGFKSKSAVESDPTEDEYNAFMDAINTDDQKALEEIVSEWVVPPVVTRETVYRITSDLLGDGEATFKEIADMVKSWEYTGWGLQVEEHTLSDEVRVYAHRDWDIDIDDSTPSRHTDWVKVTRDYCYLVVAENPDVWEE